MMFVVPPPPMRVPNGQGAFGSSAAMQSFQMQAQQSYLPPPSSLESSNSLKNPDEFLSLAEGRYVLRDEISLACPPPHPSEPPPLQPNPLASAPWVESNGTFISVCAVQDPKTTIRPDYMPAVSKDSSSADSDADSTTSDAQPTQPLFGMQSRGEMKRRKPKNNMAKSNSSFVSRIITHEHLAKRIAERSPEGLYGFININRSFQWLDLSSSLKAEPLAKILFTKAHPLCSDVNQFNKAANHLDVLIGFNTGDIMWYDPVGSKYARINKNGVFNGSAVYDIRWIPGSESLFVVAHKDGRIMIYDTEKEDGPANITDELVTGTTSFRIVKRFSSGRLSKANPVGAWEISPSPVYKIAFSPDATHLAVASEDGKLRVIDLRKERLTDLYVSYYGGFTSVAWSPDGRYLLSGGQDDLITIWSVSERRVVARCPGHTSWVTDIVFDPWGCEQGQYRFGSVGQDCRLLLWDFSMSALHRPKTLPHSTRMGITSTRRPRSNSNMSGAETNVRLHTPESRGHVATLLPIMSKQVDASPLLCLDFRKDCIITSSRLGKIRTWDRPKDEDKGRVWDD